MEANECSARLSDQSAPPCHRGEEEMIKSQLCRSHKTTELNSDFFQAKWKSSASTTAKDHWPKVAAEEQNIGL